MKTIILAIYLLVAAHLQAQVKFDPGDLEYIGTAEQKSGEGRMLPGNTQSSSNYDVKWYRCMWNIDPAVREISGNVTTLFTPSGQAIDSLVLDLDQALQVDSVIFHNNPVPWVHVTALLTVHFPLTIAQNTPDSVTVYYHGVPPENGFGSFEQNNHNGAPIIWTLSEPYGSSDWWPCKNGLTDKADSIDIYIKTPAPYKTASNGILLSVTPTGSDLVYHWKHRYPIASYLVCLAVTNYARYTESVPFNNDTLLVVNYVYPEDSATAASQTAAIVPMIQLYDTLFGVYPFQNEKYGHAQFGWGGGMEHQTMTFVSSFGFELIAHELAHQWFGDKVTCGSWSDIWLNEGFATYLSGLCYEHLAPIYWVRFRESRVKSIIRFPDGSVYCPDTTSVARIFDSRLTYAKGGMILHQLRWLLGDSVFFAAMNNYLSDVSLGYGFARTENLKSHFESSSGQDLTWYFNDWYTGEGFPSYHINWTQENDSVTFHVTQTQSHPSVAFFKMTIPVQIKNESKDTIISFANAFSGQTFKVYIPFTADSVKFDPEYQLISGNNTINGITQNQKPSGLKVFPNPASRFVTFSLPDHQSGDCGNIVVIDFGGRVLDQFIVPCDEAGYTLNTGNYPPGIYFYKFTWGEVGYKGRFTIVR